MTELHVVPDERAATWRLYDTDGTATLSRHTNATDAESAARAMAKERGTNRIVIHDRYHRTHDAAESLARPEDRRQRERARQLALAALRGSSRHKPPDPLTRSRHRHYQPTCEEACLKRTTPPAHVASGSVEVGYRDRRPRRAGLGSSERSPLARGHGVWSTAAPFKAKGRRRARPRLAVRFRCDGMLG
jgi:hypothetical protein